MAQFIIRHADGTSEPLTPQTLEKYVQNFPGPAPLLPTEMQTFTITIGGTPVGSNTIYEELDRRFRQIDMALRGEPEIRTALDGLISDLAKDIAALYPNAWPPKTVNASPGSVTSITLNDPSRLLIGPGAKE